MNKKLNAFLRILTIVVALAAVAFAFLLKGKMDVALTKTAWAVTDPEVKAGKEYDARMASLAGIPAILRPRFSASSWLGDVRKHAATVTNLLGSTAAFVFAQIISLGGLFSDLEWGYVLAFAFFIVMMFIRPAGLFARRS